LPAYVTRFEQKVLDRAPDATVIRKYVGKELAKEILECQLLFRIELSTLMAVLIFYIKWCRAVEAFLPSVFDKRSFSRFHE
jgi:hypothetical protein